MKEQVIVIKEMPGYKVGDILEMSDEGFVAGFCVIFLIEGGWVKKVEEKTLSVRFNNVYESGTHKVGKRMFELFASMANVHYLRIFDKFCKANPTFPMSTEGINAKMAKLRRMIQRG